MSPTDDVIRLSGVSKKFLIRSHRTTLLSTVRARFGGEAVQRELRALEEVSLTIRRGERIGLIGGNGSGKSTLLRLLAKIYRPSSGVLSVEGRVAGILHAGAGMLRDLSAIENAHLFGALLDIPRAELKRRLPEVLDYAELSGFAHAPLRDLSLGMVQRLAFSLLRAAAPQVLLLDELLSGTDAQFTLKACDSLTKLTDSTLVFASHDLAMVERLCGRTLFLRAGRVAAFGPSAQVLALYRAEWPRAAASC